MKTCDEFQARLSAFHDGEAGDETAELRSHLDACGACRSILDRYRRVSARLNDVEETPASLVEEIRRGVRLRVQAQSFVPRLAAAAGVAAALLWAVVLLGMGGKEAIRLSDLAPRDGLSGSERRILYGKPPTDDEWMTIILSGGSPR